MTNNDDTLLATWTRDLIETKSYTKVNWENPFDYKKKIRRNAIMAPFQSNSKIFSLSITVALTPLD